MKNKISLSQRKAQNMYRNDTPYGADYISGADLEANKWADRYFIETKEDRVEGFPVYYNVIKNDPIKTVSVGAGRYIRVLNNGKPEYIRYDDRRKLSDYIQANSKDGILGYYANKPVYSAPDGTLYTEANPPTTTIGGIQYPHVWRVRRNTTKQGGFDKLGDGWKVGDQIVKTENEVLATQKRDVMENETDIIQKERDENRARQKQDLQQANQQLGKYSAMIDQNLQLGPAAYAEKAKEAARSYAENRARQDAARTAEINRQQAQQNARNAGLSGANAALMGNSQNLQAYTNQYNQSLNAQEQSHLNEQRAGLGAITQQQQFAQSQKSEANSRLESDRDEGRLERDFATSQEQNYLSQAKEKTARILSGTNSIMALLQGLGGIISEFSNIKLPENRNGNENGNENGNGNGTQPAA